MATVEISVAEFRQRFPAFSNTTKYPDETVQAMLDTAVVYIPQNKNPFVKETVIKQMIYLMAAHLLTQNVSISAGNAAGGLVQSASVDGVSVSKALPNSITKTSLSYWLAQTAYGQQLLALMKLQATVGIYVGGQKENVFR